MRRSLFWITLIVTAALGGFGISRLDYDVDILDLLPPDMPGLEGTQVLRNAFERANRLIIAVEGADPSVTENAALSLEEHLAGMPSLCRKVAGVRERPEDATELAGMAAWAWWNAPPATVQALVERLAPDKLVPDLAKKLEDLAVSQDGSAMATTAYDPAGFTSPLAAVMENAGGSAGLGGMGAASADGLLRVITLEPLASYPDYRRLADWVEAVRVDALNDWRRAHPEFENVIIGFTGDPVFRAEIATGMERDMTQSVGGITFIVAFLFWLLHRTLKPLPVLIVSLLMANLMTLGIAGFIFGSLNVMSIGFAAILTGMIEDFGVVALHEAQEMPGATWREVCRRVLPGVAWSAVTVAAVFGSVSLSTLPGIAQLGTLTAIGILIGAAVMLCFFLPVTLSLRSKLKSWPQVPPRLPRLPGLLAAALLLTCGAVLCTRGVPGVQHSHAVLQPVNSAAWDTLERMLKKMQPAESKKEWLPVVVSATSEEALTRSVDAAAAHLTASLERGEISALFLPSALVPRRENRHANAPVLKQLAAQRGRLHTAITEAGFTDDAFTLSGHVLDRWQRWARDDPGTVMWPDTLLEGRFGNIMQRQGTRLSVLGYVEVPRGESLADSPAVIGLRDIPGAQPAGWRYLTEAVRPLIGQETRRTLLPAAGLLVVLLFFIFRNARERWLAAGTLLFSGLLLLGFMAARGMEWNFINIAAVPLSLGLGLDFTIHMIYALRRDGTGHGTGRALAYCGLSTGLGFGSLVLGSNRGLVSMGWCCMAGVLAMLFTAAFLLPWAWRTWKAEPPADRSMRPASNP